MRFLFAIVIFSLFLYIPLMPVAGEGFTFALTEAAGLVPCGGEGEALCDACAATAMVNGLINWLFGILALLAVMVMMYAGVRLVTSQGNTSQWEEAKGMLTNLIIGFVIVLAAWLIVDTLMKMLLSDDVIKPGMWNTLSADCGRAPSNTFGGPK
jgi:hypothetical protein